MPSPKPDNPMTKAEAGAIFRYDTEELLKTAIEAVEAHGLTKIGEVAAYLPCCAETARKHGINKHPKLKEALYRQRTHMKAKMRKNWMKDDAPAQLQLAAYKLMADPEEWARLGSHKHQTTETEQRVSVVVKFDDKPLQSDIVDITPDQAQLPETSEEE